MPVLRLRHQCPDRGTAASWDQQRRPTDLVRGADHATALAATMVRSLGEKDCYQQLSSFHGRQKDKVWLGRDRHEKPGRLPKSEVDGEATANEYAGNRSPRSRGGPTGAIFQIFEGWCWGHGRKRLAGHAATVYPSRSVSTTSARSTPWDCAGSGGRDVALARGKVSRAAWPLNPEKGDANFMAAARLALARRPGVHG
jgi:hypothetical protein